MQEIIKTIKYLLETKYSGGVKFVELLPDLIKFLKPNSVTMIDELIKDIENSQDLKVVKYLWKCDNETYREKYFIYINYENLKGETK